MHNFPDKAQYIVPISTLFSEKIFILLSEWVEKKFNWEQSQPSFESLIIAGLADLVVPSSKSQVTSDEEYSPWKLKNGFRN